MFQIYNGGTTFKQWSKGNKLVMDVLPVGADVLFYNETYSDSPIKSDVYEITNDDDEIIKVCDVPSALLTEAGKIKVCVGSVVTGKYGVKHSMVGPREKYFKVEPANKPAGYVEDPVPTSGGVSSWNDLTDKPFGKEIVVNETPFEISLGVGWYNEISDEDIAERPEGYRTILYRRVSDVILSNDEIKNLVVDFMDIMRGPRTLDWSNFESVGSCGAILNPDYAVITDDEYEFTIVVTRKDQVYAEETIYSDTTVFFPKSGIYVRIEPNSENYFPSIRTKEPLREVTEVVRTIDPEFLPAGVGGAFYVKFITEDGDNFTTDKTFEEVADAISNDRFVVAQIWRKNPDNGSEIRSGLLTSAFYSTEDDGTIMMVTFSQVDVGNDGNLYSSQLSMNNLGEVWCDYYETSLP